MNAITLQQRVWQQPPRNKAERWRNWFILSSSVILLITGFAKFVSGFGKAQLLGQPDPILGISFQYVFLLAGGFELAASVFCLWPSCAAKKNLRLGLIAWIATSVTGYRIGLWALGWEHPCKCLGNLTDALHISATTADWAMKGLICYLVVGSYSLLFDQWRNKQENIK